jgi:uncharacterized protein (TIGR02246 family)
MIELEMEKSEIERQMKAMEAAENRHDLDAMLEMMTKDVIVQLPGVPMIQGLDAVRQMYEGVFQVFISTTLTSLCVHVATSGEMAWQYGTHVNELKTPEGRIAQPGKWLCVFQKIDGEWKTAAACIS